MNRASPTTIPKSATCAVPLSSAARGQKHNVVDDEEQAATKKQLDNIRYLNTSPPRLVDGTPATGKSSDNNIKVVNAKKAFESDEDEDEMGMEEPIQLPFAANEEYMEEFDVMAPMAESTGAVADKQHHHVDMGGAPSTSSSSNHQNPAKSGDVPSSSSNLMFEAPDPPPELEQETLLEASHKQILAKLRFVLDLIEAIISVAENKTNPIAIAMEGSKRKSRQPQSDAYRRAEQLVLYVRALHVLSSALVMAQKQINADTLHPSPAVQNVLNQLNEKYHYCLARSQELASLGIPGQDPQSMVVSAERIMYQHAIDLCQSAALDELFGNPHLYPKRYQTAYMMLHTLLYTVQNEQDKAILLTYKGAVEKRLRILERQGLCTSVISDKTF